MRNRAELTAATVLTGLLVAAAAFAQTASTGSGSAGSGDRTTRQGSPTAMSSGSPTSASSTSGSDTTTTTSAARLKATDKTFVRKAAEGGMAEVELGRLAAAKATDPDVKAFGQKMVDDHSKANDKLKQVVATKGVELPTELSATDKAEQARLDKLSGAAFDRAYVRGMLKDHKKDVADFQRESKRAGADSDVKAFAADTLPTLQEHLKMVQDLSNKMGGKTVSKPHHASAAGAHPGR